MKKFTPKRNTPKPLPKSRLIIGRNPMIEALESGKSIEKIFILQGAIGAEIQQIRNLAKEQNIAVSFVPQPKLDRFTKSNTQGVVAIAGLIQYQSLQSVIDFIVGEGKVPLMVVLDGVTDTRNLGAIARSAFCFDADALVVPLSNSAAITEESVKTSAGALERIAICREPSIQQIMDVLHLNGIQTIATSLDTKTSIADIDLTIPTAIIMGAEDEGVSNYVNKTAQQLVRIPQSKNFDSLNVSVATGIMMYESFKQRMK